MKENIRDLLIFAISDTLKELKINNIPLQDIYLDLPKDSQFGDISTNIALKLSSLIKKNPLALAADIAGSVKKYFEKGALAGYINEVKVAKAGFINFYLNNDYFYKQLEDIIIKGSDFAKSDLGRKRRVLIEFVSANPTGPLSVAHARQAAVGDALANILEYLGFEVRREYYLNDEGNQINILGESVKLRFNELSGEKIEFPENHYQGEYIYEIAKEAKKQDIRFVDFTDFSVKYILDIIKKELDDFGVKFDCWYSQKELRQSGKIKNTFDFLREKSFLYEEDGAVWFKSTLFGDDKDRVVIKSDGAYTYLAPDIAYHQDKFKRGFSWLINLWGPDHHGYINRLKAAIEALGNSRESLSVIIVQLASISRQGKPVQMSTRKGRYITLREVLDEVGIDASRFFFMMRRTSSHLDFDLDIAKKQTSENPVYYIQYAYARISSILNNSCLKIEPKEIDFSLLKEKEEIELIKKLWQFNFILSMCLNTSDPYMLTVYLQELAEYFHKFYDLHRVLGQEEALTKARLALIVAARTVLSTGFDLLGISKPEKM